jgi:uncharacterized protein (DUF1810 family)
MWFIFPQLRELGRSQMARRFGLRGLGEARAYAAHPVVGARLRECAALANAAPAVSALDLFGSPDNLKHRSSMTLFWRATGETVFGAGLDRFHDGEEDPLTVAALEA